MKVTAETITYAMHLEQARSGELPVAEHARMALEPQHALPSVSGRYHRIRCAEAWNASLGASK